MWELFKTFFKIGCISLGGGYTMIPILEEEFVKRLKWLTTQELLEITSLSQIVPGPLATTMSTFIGKTKYGVLGAFVATTSILIPAVLIVFFIVWFFSTSFDSPIIMKAMHGARIAIIAMIAHTVSTLFKRFQDYYSFIFCFLAFLALSLGVNPMLIIFLGGLLGGLFYWSFYVVYYAKNKFTKKDPKP